ncbi:hypothetical protein [Jiella sp. M17.18]|uniref:hypothetical protein n=1 Tax=Jiella sp. M17.18 TaxID=3234247 RepID=UPI0034DEC663
MTMHTFNRTVLSFLAAGAVFGMAAAPAMAAGREGMTTFSSAPTTYGYSGGEVQNNPPRCENVERYDASSPNGSALRRAHRRLVPGDEHLGMGTIDMSIASSPVCR